MSAMDIDKLSMLPDETSEPEESDNELENSDQGLINVEDLRQKQNAKFKALLSRASETITAEDIQRATKVKTESELSMTNLIENQDFTSVIHDPREYQLELFEKAKAANIIAVLDTADRASGNPPRISFFLVDSVTLVYQQAAVLKANIDQNIDKFSGAMQTDLWSKETWEKHFSKNMIIVCTAEVLYQCLLRSFIRMEHINLLIFDEAHHAKKEHPYARIVKDFYLRRPETQKRPKIFGMTASPVDAKVDVAKAAKNLETLLDSQIATASNLDALRQAIARPTEQIWVYDKLDATFETDLYKCMQSRFGKIRELERIFFYALEASSMLGRWCSDWLWTFALEAAELPKLEGRVSKSYMQSSSRDHSKGLDEAIKLLREAGQLIRNHTFDTPVDCPAHLSSKVRLLRHELSLYFERHTDTKCIVFVQQRHTARLLAELFSRIGTRHMQTGILIGVQHDGIGGANFSFRQQFLTLLKFRKGELNCLVRPELDHDSYAHMVERDNLIHASCIQEAQRAEHIMRRFCESLPEDRIIRGSSDDLGMNLDKERYYKSFTVHSTGATLTYPSSLVVLAHYASSLQYEKETSPQVNYFIERIDGAFVCEAILPEKSPFRGLTGKPSARKLHARQSAAFETCLMLRKNGILDDHFVSKYHKRLPAMRNAKLAIKSKKTNQYDMMVKPKLWDSGRGTTPSVIWATLLMLSPAAKLRRDYQPLILFTRYQLPKFPIFPLYLEDDIESEVITIPLRMPLRASEDELGLLTTFTLRIFQDLFHKVYEHQPAMMTYWLAPARLNSNYRDMSEVVDPRQLLDISIIQYVQQNSEIRWSLDMPPSDVENRFLFDKWDGRYRYFTSTVEPTLRPSDPPPATMAKRKHMENIMNYCLSLFKNSRSKFLGECDWKQPVVRAELVRLRRNLLDRATEQERGEETAYYICPEPLRISALPPPVAAFAFAFPAIISRIESYLISLEACDKLQLSIETHLALEALTKDSDNTEEHRKEQIHFQRGMGKNYERLEFLGDCFLKMATSISLFAMNPDNDEFDFHVKRMCLICNQNLFNTAVRLKLYEFVRTQGFSRRNWYPEGIKLLQGKAKSESAQNKQALGDKTIADICEALIGASLLSGGKACRFDTAVKAVTVFVDSDNHRVSDWNSYIDLYSLPSYQIVQADAGQLDLAKQIGNRLGYHFTYPRLLRSAFTHASYPSAWSTVPCYQRLEFLGDSLLDMVCVEYLYHHYPDRDPQWLTEHKMAMVSNKFLGAVTVKLGLHKHLLYISNALFGQITRYAEEIEVAVAESADSPDAWTTTSDPPKCLPDMLEAYIGAIFVDSNFSFEVVEDFFQRYLKQYFEDMSIYDAFANKHPTAGEVQMVDSTETRIYAAVIVHDKFVAQGIASSVRYAKTKASEAALAKLEGLASFKFREIYGCNCAAEKVEEATDAAKRM
ncbi:ATP-dependent helicase DCL1 [Histoplasma capsulatum var. duboisii H88]|uniref:ATP-dependent helicase DCL1 n=1 Tax=Ajellomyces capsulatus (strain H88) TaxID=544711 RepID=F0UE52_AJEC8|nr:ATP-dependent helicase DCL1 [Histoplasma capsulatum var. duboisii H88]